MNTLRKVASIEPRVVNGVRYQIAHIDGRGFSAYTKDRQTDWYGTRPALIKALVDGRARWQ